MFELQCTKVRDAYFMEKCFENFRFNPATTELQIVGLSGCQDAVTSVLNIYDRKTKLNHTVTATSSCSYAQGNQWIKMTPQLSGLSSGINLKMDLNLDSSYCQGVKSLNTDQQFRVTQIIMYFGIAIIVASIILLTTLLVFAARSIHMQTQKKQNEIVQFINERSEDNSTSQCKAQFPNKVQYTTVV